MRLAVLGDTAWALRGAIMGAEVRAAGGIDQEIAARARLALPGLYDRMPPAGTLTEMAPAQAVAGADLVLAVPGAVPDTDAPVLSLDGPDDRADAALYAGDPAYLVPEIVLSAELPHHAGLLASLGLAVVPELTRFATDGAADPAARDAGLVGILRALRAAGQGPGRTLAATEARWPWPVQDWSQPVETADRAVPLDWTDYNGHMTEARYLHAFGDATDRLMHMLGCTPDYIAAGHSFFTAETHIRHLGEVNAGERIRIQTRAISVEGAKMRFFHEMTRNGALVATGEHFMLHVSLDTRRPVPPLPPLDAGMARFGAAGLPMPEGAGRAVGQKR